MTQPVYEYAEPGPDWEPIPVRMTEGEILAAYWDYWSGEMRRQGKRGINVERCIEDWAIAHWARRVDAMEEACST